MEGLWNADTGMVPSEAYRLGAMDRMRSLFVLKMLRESIGGTFRWPILHSFHQARGDSALRTQNLAIRRNVIYKVTL